MIANQKIALFLPLLCAGGAERVTLNVAAGMIAQGYAVDLVLAQASGPYMAQVPPGVRIIDLKAKRVLTSLPALTRYLRSERPTVLLSALDHANLVAVWARKWSRVPMRLVVAVHSTLSRDKQRSPRKRDRLVLALARYFYPRADKVVAVSKEAADDLIHEAHLSPDQVEMIYNPVLTPDMFEKAQESIEHPWFNDPSTPVVLAVGRLTDAKDYPMLIKAFDILRRKRPARLVILGEGEERSALEALVRKLDLTEHVWMPGFVDNPYAYISKASIYVLSSIWEGLPTALIEALALKRPVVSTDCKSGPREILHDGRFGKLVPPGRPERLAEGILQTLDAPPDPMPDDALQVFKLEHATGHYLRLLLNKKRKVASVVG